MHAERLLSIAKEITTSYNDIRWGKFIDRLIAAIQARIQQPAQAGLDEPISAAAKTLFEQLDKSTINKFPVTWKKILGELDLYILLPSEIRRRIDDAFMSRLVYSDLHKGLTVLRDEVGGKLTALTKLVEGFTAVGLKDDSLAPGQVEFDVAMPREAIDDQLPGFSKELDRLHKELQVLASVVKDSPTQEFRINSISTNDFMLAVNVNVDLGALLIYVLLGLHLIKANYQQQLDVAKRLDKLPEELQGKIKDWVNNTIQDEIGNLIEGLKTDTSSGADPAKVENVKGPIAGVFRYLIKKMEDGFNMDVRAAPVSDTDIQNEPDEQRKLALQQNRSRLLLIQQKSADLKVLEQQSTPILNLPPADSDQQGNG